MNAEAFAALAAAARRTMEVLREAFRRMIDAVRRACAHLRPLLRALQRPSPRQQRIARRAERRRLHLMLRQQARA